jgi:nucleoside-triphosphatase THEP1
VGGVLALKTPAGRRYHDLWTGEEMAKEPAVDGEPVIEVGRFRFRAAAFAWAGQRIATAVAAGADLVIIDEVGPLELRGAGLAAALDALPPGLARVLLVRTGLEDAAAARFAVGPVAFDPPRD